MAGSRPAGQKSQLWRNVRILLLLLVLFAVALRTWLDRIETQGWQSTLWVGIYPCNGDGTERTQHYVDGLHVEDFADIEEFFSREGQRYGLKVEQPVHIELYPQGATLPPLLEPGSGPVGIAWWSLKLRWFAARHSDVPGRAPPRIRMFVLYHDPATLQTAPDSHGLQKGLVGIVHAFADRTMNGPNNIVIAHEFLHTVGASDKYDFASGAPLFPSGYGDRDQRPLFPQQHAEIMAARRALSPQEWQMPRSLGSVVVGPETALEVRWKR
ncbi:MAG TPA: hypothetical protein VK803_03205 [Steroidobacteraceae bacterium]|jgi:hypothetical protein|nr:hypothetical protein [Steroidobacteraceae bacterium]